MSTFCTYWIATNKQEHYNIVRIKKFPNVHVILKRRIHKDKLTFCQLNTYNTFIQETPAETGMCEPRVVKTKATTAENIAKTKMYTNNSRERNSKCKAKLI